MLQDYLSEKHKKKKKRRQDFFFAAFIAVGILAIVGIWWILFRSPLLRVSQVVVVHNSAVVSSDILALVNQSVTSEHGFIRSVFGTGNMLSWPTALATSALAADPQIESLKLSKDYWSHTITVAVALRQPFDIWCDMPKQDANGNPLADEACYWFDASGVIFQTAFDTEGSALFAVHDYSQNNAVLGGKILPDIFIPNLISILNVLRQSNLNIKEVALNDIGLQEIDISTYNGPNLYFSLRFSADEDLPVLRSIIAQPGFDNLQYVDFRVENRAYYQ